MVNPTSTLAGALSFLMMLLVQMQEGEQSQFENLGDRGLVEASLVRCRQRTWIVTWNRSGL